MKARRTLLGAWVYTEVSFFVWILLGPLALFIAAKQGLSPQETTLLVSLPILSGTLLHLPVGMLTDRFGPFGVGLLVHGVVLLGLLLLVSPYVANKTVLFAGALLMGTAGVSFAVALPLVSASFAVEHQGKALGITAFGGTGALLAAFFAPLLADSYHWQLVITLALVLVLASTIIFGTTASHKTTEKPHPTLAHYLYVLRYADTYWFCLFYGVTFGGMVSLSSFLVVYFHDRFQLSPTTSGVLATLCILASAVFRPVGGWLADRRGGIRTLQIAFIVVALTSLLLTLLPKPGALFAVGDLAITMAAFGAGNGALFQLLPVRFRHSMGVITGLVGTVGGSAGFAFVFIASTMQQSLALYQPAFLFYTGLSLLALVGLASVKRRWRTTWGAPQMTNARV